MANGRFIRGFDRRIPAMMSLRVVTSDRAQIRGGCTTGSQPYAHEVSSTPPSICHVAGEPAGTAAGNAGSKLWMRIALPHSTFHFCASVKSVTC
jgi:hypothetical protein